MTSYIPFAGPGKSTVSSKKISPSTNKLSTKIVRTNMSKNKDDEIFCNFVRTLVTLDPLPLVTHLTFSLTVERRYGIRKKE
jgi:hypothetical protein